MFSYVDAALQWKDIAWIRKVTNGLPVVVKGIQSAEDAALASHYGASVIYLSNHGGQSLVFASTMSPNVGYQVADPSASDRAGRQLEGAPCSLETLLEIRKFEPWVFEKTEIWCDGGVRRGTDIIKLLALGARAVGIGRPCELPKLVDLDLRS